MSELPEDYIAVPASAWQELVQYELKCQALSAQVEALLAHGSALATAASMATGELPIGSAVTEFCVEAVKRFNASKAATPQHHLRQVRADAGRDGFIAGYMLCNDDSPLIKHNYEGFANQHHASILAGKE